MSEKHLNIIIAGIIITFSFIIYNTFFNADDKLVEKDLQKQVTELRSENDSLRNVIEVEFDSVKNILKDMKKIYTDSEKDKQRLIEDFKNAIDEYNKIDPSDYDSIIVQQVSELQPARFRFPEP